MEIVAEFSFKKGKEFIEKHHKNELREVKEIISKVDATRFKNKISREKTMKGKELYSPIALNKEFKKLFSAKGWERQRINVKTNVSEKKREASYS